MDQKARNAHVRTRFALGIAVIALFIALAAFSKADRVSDQDLLYKPVRTAPAQCP